MLRFVTRNDWVCGFHVRKFLSFSFFLLCIIRNSKSNRRNPSAVAPPSRSIPISWERMKTSIYTDSSVPPSVLRSHRVCLFSPSETQLECGMKRESRSFQTDTQAFNCVSYSSVCVCQFLPLMQCHDVSNVQCKFVFFPEGLQRSGNLCARRATDSRWFVIGLLSRRPLSGSHVHKASGWWKVWVIISLSDTGHTLVCNQRTCPLKCSQFETLETHQLYRTVSCET